LPTAFVSILNCLICGAARSSPLLLAERSLD
jgi:hypothetical protein